MVNEVGRHAPATPAEQFHIFATENLDELSTRYGSIEAAGQRYRWLREQGQIWERPLSRSEVWWATEPGVPDDLKPLDQPTDAEGYLRVLAPDVIDRRRDWLRGSGRASSDELARYAFDRHVLGLEVLRRVT